VIELATIVPLAGAAVSTLGALYVGRRNRTMSRALARFQSDLADSVFRRQLYLSLGSRALVVAERAAEISRTLSPLESVAPEIRLAETGKRMVGLDRSCERFVESWAEVRGWSLATIDLTACVKALSEALEATRLGMLVAPRETNRHSSALREIDRLARDCSRACSAAAEALDNARL
jgi:hypothetical protein